jgi:ABC-type transport system involved in cytochrome bd biosynthesis fused ATPase/permease subunit
VASFIESAVDISRALIAGRRVTDFLSLRREDHSGTATGPTDGDLVDTVSGIEVPAGLFTVIATARQDDALALVDRLSGLQPGGTWNGRPVVELDPTVLRAHLLVADNDADLFAGTLADVVSGRHGADEGEMLEALHLAASDDLVEALPQGLSSRIDSGGGNLSGGQRQRVRLARALVSQPTVLLAIDPTSAVDAATEATVVERLVRARRGRTTVVTSTSALVLAEADRVHLLAGSRLVASGTHAGLLRDRPAYAALVLRGEAPATRDADRAETP